MLNQFHEDGETVELSQPKAITPLRNAQLSKQQAYQLIDLYAELSHVLENHPQYLPMHQYYKKLVTTALIKLKEIFLSKSHDINAINTALDEYHHMFIKGIACVKQMGHLNLMSMSHATRLPDCLFEDQRLSTYFEKLSHFSIQNANLYFISDKLFSCPKLTSIFIFNCNLRALPEAISHATSLTTLNLGRNQLKALPQGVNRLVSLNKLILRENQLTQIPEEIGNFKSLCILDLCDNQIQALPSSFNYLKLMSIKARPSFYGETRIITTPEVYLNNNSIGSIPEIFKNYLCNNQGEKISLIECKLSQISLWQRRKEPLESNEETKEMPSKCSIM